MWYLYNNNFSYLFHRQHACPHKPFDFMNKSAALDHLTEYVVKFKDHGNHRRSMIRPPRKMATHNAKLESDTTNRRDFVAHPVTPPVKRPPVQFQPPKEGMATSTIYKKAYLGNWKAPPQPILPSRKEEDPIPFNHRSTHATDFVAPPVTPRILHTADHNYEPPETPFDGSTTARSDFIHYGKVPVPASLAPRAKVSERTHPMEGVTSYGSTFTTPAMPERFNLQRRDYVPPKERVSDLTTFKSSFPKHPAVKPREMKKPLSERCNADIPFENQTTNRLHYKTWDIPEKHLRPPSRFIPPTEKVSDVTTQRSDFTDYGRVPPTPSSKPLLKPNSQGPFDSLTTQKVDFRAWDGVKRPDQVRQDRDYEPPQEKFDPATTFSTAYRGIFASRPPDARPSPRPASTGKIDFTTSYNNSFSGPGYKLCRSIPLLTNEAKASQYVFSHEDSHGHKFYKQIKAKV